MVAYDPAAPVLGKPGSADVVLTFRNVHNWRNSGQAQGMFRAFFDVLKPGGVLGVVEHRANDDVAEDDPAHHHLARPQGGRRHPPLSHGSPPGSAGRDAA